LCVVAWCCGHPFSYSASDCHRRQRGAGGRSVCVCVWVFLVLRGAVVGARCRVSVLLFGVVFFFKGLGTCFFVWFLAGVFLCPCCLRFSCPTSVFFRKNRCQRGDFPPPFSDAAVTLFPHGAEELQSHVPFSHPQSERCLSPPFPSSSPLAVPRGTPMSLANFSLFYRDSECFPSLAPDARP